MKKIFLIALISVLSFFPIVVVANEATIPNETTTKPSQDAEKSSEEEVETENDLQLAKSAQSSILIEFSTGKVLFEKNSKEKLSPASMTKIMTMLLIMEAINAERISITDEVLISPNASKMGGSQVFLEAGSKMKVEDLLKAIAIASANDAAVAMAEYISGTHDTFVTKMNDKCKSLGCENTNFVNTHGLDDPNHYSTASDMALIAKELLKYEDILKYTSTYEEHLKKPDGTTTWMVNTNKLIRHYEGLDGLKTGFTSAAGYCLTSTAKRNNMRLISVVMKVDDPNQRSNDTVELLNYGFSNYKLKTILDTKHDLGQIEVINGKQKNVNIRLLDAATNLENINEERKYTYNVKANTVKAPVKVGDKVGELEVIENGKIISRHAITVKENINKANIIDLYKRNFVSFLIGHM